MQPLTVQASPSAEQQHADSSTAVASTGLSSADWAQIRALLPPAALPSQQAYLKASNTEASDRFGFSLAVSGNTVVVGAVYEDSNATGVNGNQADNSMESSGAAYVFTRSGTTWSQQAYLKPSNTGAMDGFGHSVAISGNTVVVGAPGEDSDATGVNGNQANDSMNGSGAAYVFTRSGTTWSQQAYLKPLNTGANDYFGVSVAVSGDTVVVGTSYEASNATGVNGNGFDNSMNQAGAAYVFTRSGTTWSQQAYLKASNTETSDQFGYSVAVSGDTVVVGANGEDSNATGVNGNQANNSMESSGAAYVFTRSGTTWSQQAYLKPFNTGVGDGFGLSVAVSGDTVVIAASPEDSNATGVNGNGFNDSADSSGAAYVFSESSTLPATGFTPGVATALPQMQQAYSTLGSLWLEIPSLGVEATIVGVPEGWDVSWLGNNAGWLAGTAFPTWAGNTAITAHVYGADGLPGPFIGLHELRWGDEITIHAWGQRYTYEVRQNFLTRPTSRYPLQHEEYDWVTLLTCERYDEALGAYAYRRVVRAVLLDMEPDWWGSILRR
jgi:LPXTG-site transpeptidase (sortase) family protein